MGEHLVEAGVKSIYSEINCSFNRAMQHPTEGCIIFFRQGYRFAKSVPDHALQTHLNLIHNLG